MASIDPILTAFEMAHELRLLAEKEKYFKVCVCCVLKNGYFREELNFWKKKKKSEYLSLADKLSEYSVKLLSNVRGRDELEIVLNKTGNENEEKFELLARFDLALKYKEMPVIYFANDLTYLLGLSDMSVKEI